MQYQQDLPCKYSFISVNGFKCIRCDLLANSCHHCPHFRSEPTPSPQKGTATPSSVKSLGDKVSSTPSGGGATSKNSRSASKTSVGSGGSSDSPYRTSDFYIIRVSIEEDGPETEGTYLPDANQQNIITN